MLVSDILILRAFPRAKEKIKEYQSTPSAPTTTREPVQLYRLRSSKLASAQVYLVSGRCLTRYKAPSLQIRYSSEPSDRHSTSVLRSHFRDSTRKNAIPCKGLQMNDCAV
jgi:hypothetical protein